LLAQGVEYRQDIIDRVDKRGYMGLRGIGPVLAPLLKQAVEKYDKAEWEEAFRYIEWARYDGGNYEP
jgi:hypothetical protein